MKKQPKKAVALFSGQFLFLNLLFALVYSNISFFYVYPLYLENVGESKTIIGWVMGALPLSTVLVRPLMPRVICRFGLRWTIAAGLLVIFLASVSYHPIARANWLLFCVRIVHGFGFSAFVAASFTLAAQLVPAARRAEAFGYIGAIILACVASAPLFGEALVQGFGYPALFHSAAATAFLGMLVVSLVRSWQGESEDPERTDSMLGILARPSLLLVLACTLLFINTNASLLTFLALYGRERDFSGLGYFGLASALAVLIRLFGARLMDRFGRKRISTWSFLCLGGGVMMLGGDIHAPLVFVASVLVYGLGLGYLYPGLNALAVEQAGPGERAMVMSLFTAVFDSGFLVGAVLSGWLAETYGLRQMFVLVGGAALVGSYLVSRPALHEASSLAEPVAHGVGGQSP